MARFDCCAFAVFADIFNVKLEFNFCAENCLLEGYFDVCLNIAAAVLAPVTAASHITAKETAEYIAQPQVPEVEIEFLPLATEPGERVAIGCRAGADTGMAKLVVSLALAR